MGNPDPQLIEFVTLISLTSAVIGMLFILILPKDDSDRRIIAKAFFVGGLAGLMMTFLIENPDIMKLAQKRIALKLIVMLIASVSLIELFKKLFRK